MSKDSYYNMEILTGEITLEIMDTVIKFIEKKKPNAGTEMIEVMSSTLTGLLAAYTELGKAFGIENKLFMPMADRGKDEN